MKTHHATRKVWTVRRVAVALLVMAVTESRADAWQDHAAIRAVAEAAALEVFTAESARITAAAAPLDPRLRMPACGQALSGKVPNPGQETGRVTAEVRCDDARPWRVFVPVQVTVTRTLVVAAVPLERGKVLAAGDVILAEREIGASPGGYLTDLRLATGRVLRRGLAAGAVVSPGLLEQPVIVRRGQAVSLEARAGGLTVQMAGVARSDGALGQMIPVENTSSGKVLQGIVRNEKSVEIRMP